MKNSHTILILSVWVLALVAIPAVSDAQEILFKLSGQINETHHMGAHLFGFKEEALTGVDPLDTPEPPLPPESYLSMAFALNDPLFPAITRWRDDFRNFEDWTDGIETWQMVFHTDQPEEDCFVSLSQITGVRDQFQVRLIREDGMEELTIPGNFTVASEEMGYVFVLEIRSINNMVTSISFEGLMCLFQ